MDIGKSIREQLTDIQVRAGENCHTLVITVDIHLIVVMFVHYLVFLAIKRNVTCTQQFHTLLYYV